MNHVDMKALGELKEMMKADFPVLISIYLSDTDQNMQALAAGVSALNADQIHKIAHSIKGSSSNLFAVQLTVLCQDMEERGRCQNLKGCDKLLHQIEKEYQTVRRLLDKLK